MLSMNLSGFSMRLGGQDFMWLSFPHYNSFLTVLRGYEYMTLDKLLCLNENLEME